MKTSWFGVALQAAGYLVGESTGNWRIPYQRVSNVALDIFFGVSLNKLLTKQSSFGYLRHLGAHMTSLEWECSLKEP